MPKEEERQPVINTFAGREPEEAKEPANVTIGPKEEEVKEVAEEVKEEEVTEPEEAKEEETTEEEPKKKPGRYQKRIDRLTAKVSTYEQQLDQERSEKAALLEELAKTRGSGVKVGERTLSNAELQALIKEEAKKELYIENYNKRLQDIGTKGRKQFEDFNEKVQELGELGVLNDNQFLELVMELDSPEKVLHYLGEETEEAEEILRLSSAKRSIALAKLEAKLNAKPIKEISKAPPPPKTVEAKSVKSNSGGYGSEYYEGMPMAEFVAWDNKNKKVK